MAAGLSAMLLCIASAGLTSLIAAPAAAQEKKAAAAAPSSAKPASASASSAPSKARQEMTYDVYAGGFHVVSAGLVVDLAGKNDYLLRLSAATHGIFAKLAPWHGVFQTEGWYSRAKEQPSPRIHFSDTTWRSEKELTEFLYNKDGSFKEYRVTNEKEKGKKERDDALTQQTTDVLSSTLKVMTAIAKGGKCEGSDEIFDGDRRYALVFGGSKKVEVPESRLNVYRGAATECSVEVKPIAGKWHEKPRGWMSIQEQGRSRGTMPTVWFARMAPGEPAIPVRIRVKTDYGTLFMQLTGYQGAGQSVKLAAQ